MASKWMHCPRCGHRMFRLLDGKFDIEIKCPSCKGIIRMNQDTQGKGHNPSPMQEFNTTANIYQPWKGSIATIRRA